MDELTSKQPNDIPMENTTEEAGRSEIGSFNHLIIEWDTRKHISWDSLSTDWNEVKEKAAAVARSEEFWG